MLNVNDIGKAKNDLDFIESIKTSVNDTETSTRGVTSETRIKRLKDVGYYPVNPSATWAPGEIFINYTQYLIYSGEVYTPSVGSVFPLITGASPDTNFTKVSSNFQTTQDIIDNYDIFAAIQSSSLAFASIGDMIALTTVGGHVVTVDLGDNLIAKSTDEILSQFVVVDAADVPVGYPAYLLSNGLYAKELFIGFFEETNPLLGLNKENDAMEYRFPDMWRSPVENESDALITGAGSVLSRNGIIYRACGAGNFIRGFDPITNGITMIDVSSVRTLLGMTTGDNFTGIIEDADGNLILSKILSSRVSGDDHLITYNIHTGLVSYITYNGAIKRLYNGGAFISKEGNIYFYSRLETGVSSPVPKYYLKINRGTLVASVINVGMVHSTGASAPVGPRVTNHAMGKDGNIYFAPNYNTDEFIVFNSGTDTVSYISASYLDFINNSFLTLIPGMDGYLYLISTSGSPPSQFNIYKFDISTGIASLSFSVASPFVTAYISTVGSILKTGRNGLLYSLGNYHNVNNFFRYKILEIDVYNMTSRNAIVSNRTFTFTVGTDTNPRTALMVPYKDGLSSNENSSTNSGTTRAMLRNIQKKYYWPMSSLLYKG